MLIQDYMFLNQIILERKRGDKGYSYSTDLADILLR